MLPINAATRDPRAFRDSETVNFDRHPNRHIAFGVGPHRCLGSHLARQQLQVAVRKWHDVIPDYHIPDGSPVIEHADQVLGLDTLPLRWRN